MNGWSLKTWGVNIALALATIYAVNRLAPPNLRAALKPNQ